MIFIVFAKIILKDLFHRSNPLTGLIEDMKPNIMNSRWRLAPA